MALPPWLQYALAARVGLIRNEKRRPLEVRRRPWWGDAVYFNNVGQLRIKAAIPRIMIPNGLVLDSVKRGLTLSGHFHLSGILHAPQRVRPLLQQSLIDRLTVVRRKLGLRRNRWLQSIDCGKRLFHLIIQAN